MNIIILLNLVIGWSWNRHLHEFDLLQIGSWIPIASVWRVQTYQSPVALVLTTTLYIECWKTWEAIGFIASKQLIGKYIHFRNNASVMSKLWYHWGTLYKMNIFPDEWILSLDLIFLTLFKCICFYFWEKIRMEIIVECGQGILSPEVQGAMKEIQTSSTKIFINSWPWPPS